MKYFPAYDKGGRHGKARSGVIAASAAILLCSASIHAADTDHFGKREYDAHCAVCHGKDGKGNGPYAGILDTRIADLTTLAQRNNGSFPADRVRQQIDGRNVVAAHGPRDMPIWGVRYLAEASQALVDVPYDNETFVKTRIDALTDYVSRLQTGVQRNSRVSPRVSH